ncbi:serine/threonine-protein kinase [Streptomyces sp. NPDC091027]|uniref:serine/threonine-protein kinase n=1 Tax=Streptomyces sp. NPDC091027 TaxID=3365971 RepID=UPI0037F45EA6
MFAGGVFEPLQGDDPAVVGGFRLVARLGAGGMGRVYLSHTAGGRPVALKVVRAELAEDVSFRRRFRREVEAARRVRGAYTAELIDADVEGVPPWLATVYVPGPSLSEAVERRGPLPVAAVLWLMAGVAEALQVIHRAGVVHRDLKPSNVLLAADGPRVIDFGISLASGTTAATATGDAIGTPQYMAPEQALAGETSAATDVFALGQTAAYALLGEALYGGGPAVAVLFRIVHESPDLTRLPAQVRPLIARCLAADPADRATPAEIIRWSRQRLGKDADAGGGPAVWREVAGPEVSVPAPLPEPPATSRHTLALADRSPQRLPEPAAGEPAPRGRPTRGRRTALIAAAAVAVAALTTAGIVRYVAEPADGAPGGPAAGAGPAGRTDPSAGTAGSRNPASAAAGTGTTPSPKAVQHAGLRLDEKGSVGLTDPVARADRTGDVRLSCDEDPACVLESDTGVITLLSGPSDTGSPDVCRHHARTSTSRSAKLAAAAAGSQLCVGTPSGGTALLVLRVKATSQSKGARFVTADLTVWSPPS